ncbi:histidine---tRNA ligase [Chytriomyces confervae]|uniref:histidine--tRNA ligase n=1 Tax=Chytriomyces confervae TaxID=246404 RepID=A0A507FDJ5_9FUNG|nr:histidine---tRNA ligase [Chytriomyces confervae]
MPVNHKYSFESIKDAAVQQSLVAGAQIMMAQAGYVSAASAKAPKAQPSNDSSKSVKAPKVQVSNAPKYSLESIVDPHTQLAVTEEGIRAMWRQGVYAPVFPTINVNATAAFSTSATAAAAGKSRTSSSSPASNLASELILAEIRQVTEKIKQLKTSKAGKAEIDEQVAILKSLNERKNAAANADDGGAKKFELKTPKGTRDFLPEEMAIRERMFASITQVFKRHGAVTIDTPVFELKEILTGKYGEDSKLIYDLKDQGGELASLRYDLTVPFARFLATHGISNIKRYHIAKVYRRDNPSINKGRMREFFQCDFDIAGEYGPMIPDAEIIKTVIDVLEAVEIGEFKVKINHRKILDGMFEVCGVPADKFRSISSAVDKLDKSPWAEVKKEMVQEKGLAEDVADRIEQYVKLSGGVEICDKLDADAAFSGSERAKAGVADMRLLFKYLDLFGVSQKMSFDLSLARGLDYYTGVIYEAVFESTSEETSGVGSIAAGGRYDELVGMFSPSGKKIPCVGVSVGVERVFAILLAKMRAAKASAKPRTTATQVYLVGLGNGHLESRMKVARSLWEAGVATEFTFKEKPRRDAQFKVISDEGIPVSVVFDEAKFGAGKVQVEENGGDKGKHVVSEADVVATVLKCLGTGPVPAAAAAANKAPSRSSSPVKKPAAAAAAVAKKEADDDFDLFGSDDEEEDAEKAALTAQRLKEYHAKKATKPKTVAKSMVILDVKPWDDETDMKAMESNVRGISMEGLVWGTAKLVAIGYGIKKLQITAVVEDDKVGVDDLSEKIESFDDLVQSVDVASFNKL